MWGSGGSQHICSEGFFSNGIQGSIVPVSAGMAMGQKLDGQVSDGGLGRITVVYVGDGTLGEGALYEALNIASKWELPLLVVVENNGYAQSTSQDQTLAGDICKRAEAFGIETDQSDTWRPEHLLDAASRAVRYVRETCKPYFLRVDTFRLMAHSKGDDDRDLEMVKGYWDRDPIELFRSERSEEAERILAGVTRTIADAVALADGAAYTQAVSVDDDVPDYRPMQWSATEIETNDRVANRIHGALRGILERDDRVLLMGEDIEGPYGGAFKITKNLQAEFPGRVRNTPISESAIVGIGTGLALTGKRPICEIMFGDFLALAADQLLNSASKFRYMYNDQVSVPLVIRTPMGGKRGYGPTHSQSIEKHFLGIPGTRMLAIHHRYDPALVYDHLLDSVDRPTIVIENKLLYAMRVSSQTPDGFCLEHSDEPFPTTRIRPEGRPDVTVLCYGGMLADVERAVETLFESHDMICEIVCPMQLYPLNPWPVIESVRKCGRLLVVEEGVGFAAFGAEVVAQMLESDPGVLRMLRRVGSPRHPIPSCGPLEKALLPGAAHVIEAAVDMLDGEDGVGES